MAISFLRRLPRCLGGVVALAGSGVLAQAPGVAAEPVYMEHERHGAWEMSLHYNRLGSQRLEGLMNGTLDVDNGNGWGATVAYNFTNQWSLGLAMMSGRQDYQPADISEVPSHTLDLGSTQLQATWHLRPEGLTPFVTLGAGWLTVDSNIASGAPRRDCWWDAWGYSCSSYYPTFSDNKTAVTASAGMRWDFHRQFFTRLSYGKTWMDDDSSSPSLVRLEFGIRR